MTDRTPAAQAPSQQTVLTREQIGELYKNWICVFGVSTGSAELCIREIEAAVLSALRAPVADERQALAHVANEWADMACNAMVWIRNIQDGISTPKEALVSLMSNLTHCQEVQSCAGVRPPREYAPVAGERAAELMEEARSEGHSSVAAYVDQLKTSAATYREERNSARDAVARYRGESIARAALASSPVAIPAGWRLVPIAPTPEMESAGCDVPFGQDDVPAPATVYAAMLNAAPAVSAPVAGETKTDVNAAMAAEYQRWIDYYHQGRDYDDFLKECVYGHKSAPMDISSGHSDAIDTSPRCVEQSADHRHDAAPQASEAVRDAERLEWLLRHIPGDALRRSVGVLSDTSDVGEFRRAIDAALSAQPAQKEQHTDGGAVYE